LIGLERAAEVNTAAGLLSSLRTARESNSDREIVVYASNKPLDEKSASLESVRVFSRDSMINSSELAMDPYLDRTLQLTAFDSEPERNSQFGQAS
jgi:hypothetical protein